MDLEALFTQVLLENMILILVLGSNPSLITMPSTLIVFDRGIQFCNCGARKYGPISRSCLPCGERGSEVQAASSVTDSASNRSRRSHQRFDHLGGSSILR